MKSTHQVRRHRYIYFLRFGEVEVVHDVLKLRERLRQPRIELLLLIHSGDGLPLVVVSRVNEAVSRQTEDLLMDRLIQSLRTTLLEVGASAAADEQSVAGEGHALVFRDVRHASVCVSRRLSHRQTVSAEADAVSLRQLDVSSGSAVFGDGTLQTKHLLLQESGASDVIGVTVSVQGHFERQAQFIDELQISVHRLQHWIDQNGLSAVSIRQQVCVRAALRLEELSEERRSGLHQSAVESH